MHICVCVYVCMHVCMCACMYVLYISELTPGTNRSLVSFTSRVISSDNMNRGLVLFTMSA